jgi:hypothetical protein
MWTKRILSGIAASGIALSMTIPAFAYVDSTYDVKPTRREIRSDRDQNAPLIGQIRSERATAVSDNTGLSLMPIRGSIRAAGLVNRQKLSAARGGMYKTIDYTAQGDKRHSASSDKQELNKSPLPPSLVQTGRDYEKPMRRAIRGNRDLNNYNRR